MQLSHKLWWGQPFWSFLQVMHLVMHLYWCLSNFLFYKCHLPSKPNLHFFMQYTFCVPISFHNKYQMFTEHGRYCFITHLYALLALFNQYLSSSWQKRNLHLTFYIALPSSWWIINGSACVLHTWILMYVSPIRSLGWFFIEQVEATHS